MKRTLQEYIDDYIEYFDDNTRLAKLNENELFEPEEMVALIIHSLNVNILTKIEDIIKMKEFVSQDIARQIDDWVINEKKKLKYISETNEPNIAFVVSYMTRKDIAVFHTYAEASAHDIAGRGEVIASFDGKIHGHVIKNMNTKIISSIVLNGVDGIDNKSPLEDLTIHLKTDFKEGELLHVGSQHNLYAVVLEESEAVSEKELPHYAYKGIGNPWILVDIPVGVIDAKGKTKKFITYHLREYRGTIGSLQAKSKFVTYLNEYNDTEAALDGKYKIVKG